MSARQARALGSLAEPIVASFGCDLEAVTIRQVGKRRLVRIAVDTDGGLPLDLVADISRAVSRALDESDILTEAYVLEVTSPGVHRPLAQPRHWARARGRLVSVTPRQGAAFVGRLLASDETTATLDVEGARTTVAFGDVARAVVQVELSRLDEVELDEGVASEAPGQVPIDADVPQPGRTPPVAGGTEARGPDGGGRPAGTADHDPEKA